MRHGDSFYIRHEEPLALSVLDTVPYGGGQRDRYITRIQVPPSHRQQGHGAALMRECCQWADETGRTLWLEIGSSGPLDNSQLYEWFGRFGFRGPDGGPMHRRPA